MTLKRMMLPLVAIFAWTLSARGESSCEDVSLRDILESAYYTVTNDVRRLSTAEAIHVVDEVFMRDERHRFDETTARKLKRLLADGIGEMYEFDRPCDYWSADHEIVRQYAFVTLLPEVFLPYHDEIQPERLFCVDAYVSKTNAARVRVNQTFNDGRDFGRFLPSVRRFDSVRERQTSVDRELIADVESVKLQSLSHLDDESFDKPESIYSDSLGSAHANYLVTMRVREPNPDTGDLARFSFPVIHGRTTLAAEDAWLFFRGMTLSIGFASSNGVERVVRVDPVLPYSPYAKDGVRVLDGENDRDLYGWAMARDEGDRLPRDVTVNYADHTLVSYSAPSNLLSGVYGEIPDFTSQVDITVWTDGAEARPDYWRDAWFSLNANEGSGKVCSESRVSVRSAYDALPTSGHQAFQFALRGIKLPYLRFEPPATMKDVADFLTAASKTFCRGRREFAYIADETCAARTVRPFEKRDISVLKGFEDVCTLNGCRFYVVGTNVMIHAMLPEAELEPPNLEKLLSELEAEGFASVQGAEYAAGCFRSALKDAWVNERTVLPMWSWPGRTRQTWIRPHETESNLVRMVTAEGLAWNVACVDDSNSESVSRASFVRSHVSARLERDIAKLIFALEEGESVNDEAALVFAMQLMSAGRKDAAGRIVELLWRRPADARRALTGLRTNLAKARAEYPDVEAWEARIMRKLDERKKQHQMETCNDGE